MPDRPASDRPASSSGDTHDHPGSAVDPLDDAPATTPRGAVPLAIAGFVLGLAAFLPTGLSFVLGPAGMLCGLVAHLKGRREGFAAAVLAGIGTVVGLSVRAFVDIY